MNKSLAQIITYTAEPIIVLALLVFGLIYGQPPTAALAGLTFMIVGFFPLSVFYVKDYLKSRRNTIDPGRKERNGLYLTGVFSFSFASIIFGSAIMQNELWFYMSMLFAVFFALFYLVNLYFDKASFHAGSFVLTVVVLTSQVDSNFALLLALLPLLFWSRLIMHKHEWVELMWGLALGLSVGLLAWAI